MPAHVNKSHVIFIGGGGDQEFKTHIVKDICDEFKKEIQKNPNITASYRAWHDETIWSSNVTQEIVDLKKKDPRVYLAVVGHSYGGSAAVKTAQNLDGTQQKQGLSLEIDLLITLDPVSRVHPCPKKRPQSVRYWINVDADADETSMNDVIANIGGNWGDKVKPLADVYFDSKLDHAYARSMLRQPYKLGDETYTAWGVLVSLTQWGASDRGPHPRGGLTYVVAKNDTLWGISKSIYGKGEYWWLIRDANPTAIPKGSTLIKPGMTLLIPPVLDEVVVTASRGR